MASKKKDLCTINLITKINDKQTERVIGVGSVKCVCIINEDVYGSKLCWPSHLKVSVTFDYFVVCAQMKIFRKLKTLGA